MQTSMLKTSAPKGEAKGSSTAVSDTLVGRIHACALAGAERVALGDGQQTLTFAQLEARANRLAHYLADLGARPEVCVGLLLERSVDFVVAALGVLKAQAAYLPIDSSTPRERVEYILKDAGAPILISHRNKSAALHEGDWRVVDLDGADRAVIDAESDALPEIATPNEQLAYVVYTSGSTGRPKGVEITHGNLLNLIQWHQTAFEVTSADRASQVAGLGFDAAGWEIWPHLAAGASLHIADEVTRRSPQTLHDWLLAEKITVSFVPTVLAEQLLHMNWPTDAALRVLLTGADTLHRRPAANLPFVFVNNYGPTECTVVSTSGIVQSDAEVADDASLRTPSIGKPILNTTAFILDETLKPVPAGRAGELCLAGELVGRGYRNQPAMTAEKFTHIIDDGGMIQRIYRTGDRARLLPNGEIAFLGRLDDQIKIRGYRIELGEIVSCLNRYPNVEASAVVPTQNAAGPALLAYLVPTQGTTLVEKDVRSFLAARLPDYMVPAQFVVVDHLPLTANGKLDRAALPPPDAKNLLTRGDVASSPTATDAAGGLQAQIGQIVAALLNQPSVKSGDNFFMIGGHSMLGVQLVARIRDTFGVKLSLRQLFGAPTVTALAAEVTKLTAKP